MSVDPTTHLQKKWVEQLHKEFENICWYYRVPLRRPLFVLEDAKSYLGKWDPASRTIVLTFELILNNPWSVVLEVLKHEMAHQYVNEMLGVDDATHGDHFEHACEKLGIAEWARNASGDLPDSLHAKSEPSDEEASLLRRVDKLLNLAQSSNEHESALAMMRVRELHLKYNFRNFQFSENRYRDYETKTIHLGKKRVSRVETALFSLLNEHYMVRVVFGDLYDALHDARYKIVELVGRKASILMAEHVYFFLKQTIERLWKEFFAYSKDAALRASYQLGIIRGFDSKLRQMNLTMEKGLADLKQVKSLMIMADRDLEKYLLQKFPRLASRYAGRSRLDAQAYSQGISVGKLITVSKPITSSAGFGGFLSK